ncbi:EfeM/EfeO family lipoprotein [Nonomuraea jiangxiensis]|uniref:Iron uptake system component EfeO n=1 Tax=Nonomuraea jiangxiensis TaxID=633440 RepID=A0A1G8I3F1_9ACTN|nr:EfeM/EfeO family lipoprotein [Nonomuraea jiangxiensis]SDI13393.1 iron uptake system component EfeO [Nonomuraea jiangxiensis]
MEFSRPGAAILACLLLVTGCTTAGADEHASSPPRTSTPPGADPVVQVSASHCGEGWTNPHAGRLTLMLSNTGDAPSGADLIEVPGGAVHAEVEGLGPGVTRPMSVSLAQGTYAIRCEIDERDPIVGPSVTVTGTGTGGPAIIPVSYADLFAPAKAYSAYVSSGLKTLLARTRTLTRAVDRGDLAAARKAWLPAHLAYESLGSAYGTFGEFDGAINGHPAGLPGGVHDKDFTGLHRVEYGLWHGESAERLRPIADRLLKDVKALDDDFPDQRLEPGDLPLRAHEILENTLRFELTGRSDQGSGTTLATAAANVQGTRETLGVLRPLLEDRYPAMKQVDEHLDQVDALLAAQHHGDTWTPVDRLAPRVRQPINGAVGGLLEELAPIAEILFPRRTK